MGIQYSGKSSAEVKNLEDQMDLLARHFNVSGCLEVSALSDFVDVKGVKEVLYLHQDGQKLTETPDQKERAQVIKANSDFVSIWITTPDGYSRYVLHNTGK